MTVTTSWKRSHYSYCILNLAQAYEVFFSHYLRVELLYKSFSLRDDPDLVQLNRVSKLLFEAIKTHAFEKLRAIFVNWVLSGRTVATLDEAELAIAELKNLVGVRLQREWDIAASRLRDSWSRC